MVDLPYWTVVNLLRGILSPVCRIEVRGTRQVPAGPWILACNHLSHFDPPLIAGAFSRPIDFLAMRELFQPAWFGSLMKKCHVISVGREDVDTAAFKTVLQPQSQLEDAEANSSQRKAGHFPQSQQVGRSNPIWQLKEKSPLSSVPPPARTMLPHVVRPREKLQRSDPFEVS